MLISDSGISAVPEEFLNAGDITEGDGNMQGRVSPGAAGVRCRAVIQEKNHHRAGI